MSATSISARLATGPGHAQSGLGAAPFGVLCGLLIAAPLGLLLTYAFRSSTFAGAGPGPTLEQFRAVLESEATLRLIGKTLAVGFFVSVVVTLLSLVFAYATTFRMRRRTALIVLTVVLGAGIVSFIVRVYAWGTILGTNGLINGTLSELGLIGDPLGFLYFGYFAIVVAMTYVYLPIGVIMVYSAMQDIDPRAVEASRDLGMGRWRTLTRVVAPQARGGLVGAFVLISVLASADFITPQIVGGTRGQMLGLLIRDQALTTGDFPGAAAVAISFTVAFLALIAATAGVWRLLRGVRRRIGTAIDRRATALVGRTPARFARSSLSRPATMILTAYLVMPTLVVLVFSFNSAPSLGLPWEGFTLDWYSEIVGKPGFGEALTNTLTIAVLAIVGATVVGVPCAFALRRAGGRLGAFLWSLVLLPWVIPGVLLGLGLLTAADQQGLRLGLAVTAAAHILLVAPIVIMVVYARLTAMNPQLPEAARDLGSSSPRAFRTVTLPLILPSLLGAALIGAAFSLDEVLVTTFTIGLDTTLPIWLLGQARVGFDAGINALGVMLMGGTLLFFTIALLLLRGASSRSPAS